MHPFKIMLFTIFQYDLVRIEWIEPEIQIYLIHQKIFDIQCAQTKLLKFSQNQNKQP